MDFYETTLSSKVIYSGKILSLRLDEVRLPNGKTSTREIVDHPGAVAIVALNDKNEVLMVKQYRKPVEEVLLEIPAGKVERGEVHEACAQRELMEETGFFARNLQHITDFYTSPGFCSERMHLYLARDLVKKQGQADDDEYIQLEAVPMEEAVKKVYDGEIKDAKTISGLLLVYSTLKGAL
ncbi:MAG TPA: NUDIX hydrolase [Thermoanaerobacterales bacterium]|nr:NUDIX hydrolase [Thermoanaerobacterales bacterium]